MKPERWIISTRANAVVHLWAGDRAETLCGRPIGRMALPAAQATSVGHDCGKCKTRAARIAFGAERTKGKR